MNERIWDKFLTGRDKAVFAASGYGARAGFGKPPALRVVDVNWAFCGERPEPILESIERWRFSCGEESWVALEYIKSLIEAARAKGLPVIYTTAERRPDDWDAGSWWWKSTRSDEASGTAHDDIDGNERDRRHDCTRPAGHRDHEAEAVGFLRDEPRLLSHSARLRQRDHRRDNYFGLRAPHRGRRLQP
jgi:hypothetical protein